MTRPSGFVIFAGPLAWFAELNIGYAFASTPCFRADQRSNTGLLGLATLCMLIALWAFLSSMGALRQQSDSLHSTTAAGSRPRFAALWGVALGGGFFVATLLTGVGLIVLPRCGG
jgi:uncharacterized BrkB/YihY/UPF0761 family membrane protein